MDKKDIINKTVSKLAQSNKTVEDAKDIGKRIMPLVEEYQKHKSNSKDIADLIRTLSGLFTVENSSEEKLRGILFTFRDNGFFDYSETQYQWNDLAEAWDVRKYFPHLINKTKMLSS